MWRYVNNNIVPNLCEYFFSPVKHVRAYFSHFRRDEPLRLNTFSMRDLRSRFERILTFDDHHLVAKEGGFECWIPVGEQIERVPPHCRRRSSTLHPLTTYFDELLDNGDKHESRWRNRLPRDNLPNVQFQTRLDSRTTVRFSRAKKSIIFDSVKEEHVGWKYNWITWFG